MKIVMSILMLLVSTTAFAASYSDISAAQTEINHVNPEIANKWQMGRLVTRQSERVLKCTYDFSKLGGAIGSVNLQNEDGKKCIVPNKAIIENALIDNITTATGNVGATIALTAQTAGDLKAATAFASYTGLLAGVPVDTAATAIKMTADRTVLATIATATITAGKFNVLIRYVMSE